MDQMQAPTQQHAGHSLCCRVSWQARQHRQATTNSCPDAHLAAQIALLQHGLVECSVPLVQCLHALCLQLLWQCYMPVLEQTPDEYIQVLKQQCT